MTPEEKDKIIEALAPLRDQAWREGFQDGINEGVRRVYNASMVQMEQDVIAARVSPERDVDSAVERTKPFRDWMRATWPDLCR